jgi:hypothetical protein
MGKDMGVMAVDFLCTRRMGMLHLVVLRLKRVWQVGDLLFPYCFKDRVVGPEFVHTNNFTAELTGPAIIDQHPVTEKLFADGGAVRINNTEETLTFGLPVHKHASLKGAIFTIALQFLKLFCKLIAIFRQHMNMKEFIDDSITAIVIMSSNFSVQLL